MEQQVIYKPEESKLIIKNVPVYWDKTRVPDKDKSGQVTGWSIKTMLSPETVKTLKKAKINKQFKDEVGIELKTESYPDYEGYVLQKWTQVMNTKAGQPLTVSVVDEDGKPFDEGLPDGQFKSIGNGSVCHLLLFAMEGQGASSGKINTRLNVVKVIDLVEWEGSEGSSEGKGYDEDFGEYQYGSSEGTPDDDFEDSDDPFA